MKKSIIVFLAVIVLLFVSSSPQQQTILTPVELSPGDSVLVRCAYNIQRINSNPKEWRLLCPQLTATPTRTTIPSLTASPQATLTPSGHDTTHWHPVSFGHEHGDDPNAPAIVAIFGAAGAAWNGETDNNIGVPFATSPIENTVKHAFGKYYTMTSQQIDAAWIAGDPAFTEDTDNGGNPTANRIRAWRILAHGGGSLMESLANNHSIFTEIQVCTRGGQCGIMRAGGWMFYGKFQAPFYNQVFERSGGTFDIGGHTMNFSSDAADLAAINSPHTVFDNWGGEPYWFMFPRFNGTFDVLAYARNNPNAFLGDQISSNEVGRNTETDCAPFPVGSRCGNRLFHVAIRIFDGWNLADASNINNPIFICSQIAPSNCNYNGTWRGMKEVAVYIDPAWDGAAFDTDQRVGFVSFSRYTDRYQRNPVAECGVIAVDCVPLILDGVPVGFAGIKMKIQAPVAGLDRDYDCPQGGCISFPN